MEASAFTQEKKVFVLDDHEVICNGIMHTIQQNFSNYRVTEKAGSTKELFEKFHNSTPNLLIADLELPGETIFDRIQNIRASCPSIKIILFSAHLTDVWIQEAIHHKIDAIVSKFDSIHHLLKAIQSVHSGVIYYSPKVENQILTCKTKSGSAITRSSKLSRREISVLRCIGNGLSNKDVAKNLGISIKTVDRHKCNIMKKLQIRTQLSLARFALQEKISTL
jgi:DNA-binding NarL/FixJ family response regulator